MCDYTILPYKANRQYLLTGAVTRYCRWALHGSVRKDYFLLRQSKPPILYAIE